MTNSEEAHDGKGIKPEEKLYTAFKDIWPEYDAMHAPEKIIRRNNRSSKALTSLKKKLEDRLNDDGKITEQDARAFADEITGIGIDKKYGTAAPKEKPTEMKNDLLRLAGIDGTYQDLILEMTEQSETLMYDQLPENSKLRQLIQHVASLHDPEGRKVQRLTEQILRNYEMHAPFKQKVADITGNENLLQAHVKPEQALQQIQGHYQDKAREYQRRSVPAPRPPKPIEGHSNYAHKAEENYQHKKAA